MKSQERAGIEDEHLAGCIGDPEPIKDRQKETVENRHNARGLTLADVTRILSQRHITAVVQPIFNRPMIPNEVKEAIGSSLSRSQTREP